MAKNKEKDKRSLSRHDTAQRLRAIADQLEGGSTVALQLHGSQHDYPVADTIEFETEIGIEGDRAEVEIEISWTATAITPNEPSTPGVSSDTNTDTDTDRQDGWPE